MEGRDIGTVVFPDADVKIFLDASPEERARRRATDPAHASGRGTAAIPDVATALDERDRQRSHARRVAARRRPTDAVVIDTTGLSIDDVGGTGAGGGRNAGRSSDSGYGAQAFDRGLPRRAKSSCARQACSVAVLVVVRRRRVELPALAIALGDLVGRLQLLVVLVLRRRAPCRCRPRGPGPASGCRRPGASSPTAYASSQSASTSPAVISGLISLCSSRASRSSWRPLRAADGRAIQVRGSTAGSGRSLRLRAADAARVRGRARGACRRRRRPVPVERLVGIGLVRPLTDAAGLRRLREVAARGRSRLPCGFGDAPAWLRRLSPSCAAGASPFLERARLLPRPRVFAAGRAVFRAGLARRRFRASRRTSGGCPGAPSGSSVRPTSAPVPSWTSARRPRSLASCRFLGHGRSVPASVASMGRPCLPGRRPPPALTGGPK